ncbi:MAG TPA: FAD-binding oxidoreductase [Thermohalobaculum sp.]|nr:FAD-binding oxidoreductase [Thermohalobaculum sp.]
MKDRFAAIVGENGIRTAAALAGLNPGFHQENFGAGLAVLPRSTAEVAAVVALCHSCGTAVVPQGGRTGLSGGAISTDGQVILMTDRLDRIIEIDPLAMFAVVEAGITLQALDEAAAQYGLTAGIDLAARGTATIGGMISTNAGGMEAFRNGTMRNRLLGLEVVLPDGAILDDMTRVLKCNEGYDVKQLFCGAEGTLGVVTRAVLRLSPAEGAATTVLATCPDAAAALDLFRRLQYAPDLSLLRGEIMWRSYACRVANAIGLSRVLDFANAPIYAIFEVAALATDTDMTEALLGRFAELMETATVTNAVVADAVVAGSERERGEIWRIREESFAIDQTLPHALWYDVSVPLTDLDSYAAGTVERLAALDPTLEFYLFGHLGDGNLHVTIGNDQTLPTETAKAVSAAVYANLKSTGGAISAEHGIGTEKRAALRGHASPEKLRMMAAIKHALDPKDLMNPGKVL